jgi:hypothetical protein
MNVFKSNVFASWAFNSDSFANETKEQEQPQPTPAIPLVMGGGGAAGGGGGMRSSYAMEVESRRRRNDLSGFYYDAARSMLKESPVGEGESLEVEIRKLKAKLEAVDGFLADAKRNRRMVRLLRRKLRKLSRMKSDLEGRIGNLEAEIKAEAARRIAPVKGLGEAVNNVPVPLPWSKPWNPPVREYTALAAAPDPKKIILYGAGAAAVALGTYYLVPNNLKFLKFLGYSGASILGLFAVVKGLQMYAPSTVSFP